MHSNMILSLFVCYIYFCNVFFFFLMNGVMWAVEHRMRSREYFNTIYVLKSTEGLRSCGSQQ